MRKAGILLPISSLPSPYGIGTLGKAAFDFVDFLAQAGQSLWQILPLGPTGYGDSPYQSFSAFAGSPYYIDLDLLCSAGLLLPGELQGSWGSDASQVNYALLFQQRFTILAKAAARQDKAAPDYRDFCAKNAHWLDDYALYMSIKEAHGQVGFAQWPEALRRRQPLAMKAARARYAPRVEFWRCLQYFFFTQWQALKTYAAGLGVGIVGDIPIYVSADSSDLWANPELFFLNDEGRPSVVAGVPPDGFSSDGQLWGNPLFNWKAHRRTRFAWWLARLKQAGELFDITRIDHFRGFAGYYEVPGDAINAVNGRWVPGPGKDFIKAVNRALPKLQIIAEDLGFLTEDVYELLAYSGYPGMKVLQFAFDTRDDSDYLPHNYPRHCVVYTGTHDNNTTVGWSKEAKRNDVAFAGRYLGKCRGETMAQAMVRAAMGSVADTTIIPIQDWLSLDGQARINKPATLGNNWCWRLLPGQLNSALAAEIALSARTYGRLSPAKRLLEQYAQQLEDSKKAAAEPVPPADDHTKTNAAAATANSNHSSEEKTATNPAASTNKNTQKKSSSKKAKQP